MNIKIVFSASSDQSASDRSKLKSRLVSMLGAAFNGEARLAMLRQDPNNIRAIQAVLEIPDGGEQSFVRDLERHFGDQFYDIDAHPEVSLVRATLTR